MNSDTARMHRLTLRFADAGLEKTFAEAQARKAVRPVRIALVCLCALMVGFYVLTVHVFHGLVVGIGGPNMLRVTIVALAVLAVFYALTHRPVFVERQQPIMFLVVCVMSAGVTRSSALLPLEVLESRGFTMMLMHIFMIYSVFRLRFPSGEIGRVNISAYTFDLIRAEFDCAYRGKVDAKGKGQIDMYFVTGARQA